MAQDVCPDTTILDRFVVGLMSENDAIQMEGHITHCPRCAELIQTRHPEDKLVAALKHIKLPTRNEALEAIIPWLKRLRPNPTQPTIDSDNEILVGVIPTFDFLNPPEQPGDIGKLGSYRILDILGAGGMGMVFLAQDPKLHRRIAIKVIKPEHLARPELHAQFQLEAQAVAALHHDNIITIYHIEEGNGFPYLVMPLLQGESLEEYLQKKGKLTTDAILELGRQIASGLQAAHAQGLVHRDIKPGNLFLERLAPVEKRGPNEVMETGQQTQQIRVKILDFGLARSIEKPDDKVGSIQGTPAYMSPEQARGMPATPRSDLFSLGCVLYRMATGEIPFHGPDMMATLLRLAMDEPRSIQELAPEIPANLRDLIHRLLAKKPDDRPASAQLVVDEIEAIQKSRKPKSSMWRWLAVGAVVLALAIAVGTFFISRSWFQQSLDPVTVRFTGELDKIIIQSTDESQREIALQDQTTWQLTPGTYKAWLKTPVDKRKLSPSTFVVKENQILDLQFHLVGEIRRQAHTQTVRCVAVAPGTEHLVVVSGSNDRKLAIWNVDKEEEGIFLNGHEAPIHSIAISPDGKKIASAARLKSPGRSRSELGFWNLEQRKNDNVKITPNSINALAYLPNNHLLLFFRDKGLMLFSDAEIRDIELGRMEPEIISIVTQAKSNQAALISDDQIMIMATHDLKLTQTLAVHSFSVRACAFSPNGEQLATVGLDGKLRIWNLATGRSELIFERDKSLHAVAWSTNGKLLALAGDDEAIHVLNSNGEEMVSFLGHQGAVYSLAFSNDDLRLVSGSADWTVRIWELP